MGIVYKLSGKFYDFLDENFEKKRYGPIRKEILKNLSGKILDAGCGTGRNFPYYSEKTNVTAVDRSPEMLKAAKERIKTSKAKITIKQADLTSLPFADNTFDATVATFVLCVMPPKIENQSLKEMIRVTKKNGKLYFLEYTHSKNFFRRLLMRITSPLPKILFSLRFNTTLPLLIKTKTLSIEETKFVYKDIVRLIMAKKN